MSAFLHLGPLGLNPDQLSEHIEPVALGNAEGRYLQLYIENDRGRVVLKSIGIEAMLGPKNMYRKEGRPSR